jgi:hypothetical protein
MFLSPPARTARSARCSNCIIGQCDHYLTTRRRHSRFPICQVWAFHRHSNICIARWQLRLTFPPHVSNNWQTTTVLSTTKIWSWVPEGARSQDGRTDWLTDRLTVSCNVTLTFWSQALHLQDGESMCIWNVGNLPQHYIVSQTRRPQLAVYGIDSASQLLSEWGTLQRFVFLWLCFLCQKLILGHIEI